jgi:hypothetical protein
MARTAPRRHSSSCRAWAHAKRRQEASERSVARYPVARPNRSSRATVPEAQYKSYATGRTGHPMMMGGVPHVLTAPETPLVVRRVDLGNAETVNRLRAEIKRGFAPQRGLRRLGLGDTVGRFADALGAILRVELARYRAAQQSVDAALRVGVCAVLAQSSGDLRQAGCGSPPTWNGPSAACSRRSERVQADAALTRRRSCSPSWQRRRRAVEGSLGAGPAEDLDRNWTGRRPQQHLVTDAKGPQNAAFRLSRGDRI